MGQSALIRSLPLSAFQDPITAERAQRESFNCNHNLFNQKELADMAKPLPRNAKSSRKRKYTKKRRYDDMPNEDLDETGEGLPEAENEQQATAAAEEPQTEHAEQTEQTPSEESTHEKYERIKKGNLYLADLQKLSVSELHEMAKAENIKEFTALKKQELIFRILKERIRQNGLMYGEGVLEVLPDGYGFLRNPDYNYLSSPDDIYVSPSQIRRFGLRTGNVVSGQIRPPKDSEKYFALLRVEAINFENPDKLAEKTVFSDLTPLHPEERLILETTSEELSMRIMDLATPVGMGQRGLI